MAEIINKDTFEEKVLGGGTTVVDFFATWCGPCRMLAPILEEAEGDHPEIRFVKVDIDQSPELAMRYGVMSVPTLMKFVDGQPAGTSIGLVPREELETFIA